MWIAGSDGRRGGAGVLHSCLDFALRLEDAFREAADWHADVYKDAAEAEWRGGVGQEKTVARATRHENEAEGRRSPERR